MNEEQFRQITERLLGEFAEGKPSNETLHFFQFLHAVTQTETLLKNNEASAAHHTSWSAFIERDLALNERIATALEKIADALSKPPD